MPVNPNRSRGRREKRFDHGKGSCSSVPHRFLIGSSSEVGFYQKMLSGYKNYFDAISRSWKQLFLFFSCISFLVLSLVYVFLALVLWPDSYSSFLSRNDQSVFTTQWFLDHDAELLPLLQSLNPFPKNAVSRNVSPFDGLVVAPSLIPGAGLGTLATQDFEKGDFLGGPRGKLVNASSPEVKNWGGTQRSFFSGTIRATSLHLL